MFIQILTFAGPRSPEERAAAVRAAHERIDPLIMANPDLVASLRGGFRAEWPDGGDAIFTLALTEEALDDFTQLVRNSELLPSEDVDVFASPTRMERLKIVDVAGPLGELLHQPAE